VSGRNLDNAKVLDNTNLFPSVNLIQKFGLKTNLRGSYTRTTARPSFKELSFAQILDPLTNRIFNGSLFPYDDWAGNLVPTMIDNLDIRWEKFYSGSEIFSFSLFYKHFADPIELVRIPQQQTSTEYQPRNVGSANLYGVEFEMNKSLSFISPALEKISFNSNITVAQSAVTMTDLEFNARKAYEKPGENLKSTRNMAGQSPYIVNAGFTYTDSDKGISSGFFYNVKGATLTIVGSGLFPDVYTLPYNNLNFSFNKSFGKDEKFNFNFRSDNILNDNIDVVFRAYNAQDQVFSSLSPRRSFSLGLSYKF
jgi:outer membrane receptor protein involved in Fe transport